MEVYPNRRQFLKTAAITLGFPTLIPGSALGKSGYVAPSNRIVMGGIGIGPRGRKVLRSFLQQPDVQFVAIADVQQERREIVKRMVNREYGNEDCETYIDMFEVLGRDDIDVVQITTGDRWHALASIYAAKAAKDVYCEKPCSMSIEESIQLANAFKQNERVFQAGTQRRSVNNFVFAAKLARSGKLGELQKVHAGILHLMPDREALPEEPLPDPSISDWDRWLGPAPRRPYNSLYTRGKWRGYYDFHAGNGLLEWGSHTVDLCQWAASADHTCPITYEYRGDDYFECKYANGVKLVMRLSGFESEGDWHVTGTCPIRFEGTEGWVEADDRNNLVASHPSLLENRPSEIVYGTDPTQHVRNFLNCVKTRQAPITNETITRNGHIASHAAAIAWQLGRKLEFDPANTSFINNEEANRLRSRNHRKPWTI